MDIDWGSLGKLDIIFGITGGVVLVFSAVRWIAARVKSEKTTTLLAWAVTGEEDKRALVTTMQSVSRLFFAASVWAIIGALIGGVVAIGLTLLAVVLGSQVSGTATAIAQYAVFGAIIGSVFRVLVWPTVAAIFRNWKRHRELYNARRDDFVKQKQRVESKITGAKGND